MLQSKFAAENIDARVFFWPLSSLDMFESVDQNENSWSIPQRAINLPSYHEMSLENIARVLFVIKKLG